MLKQVLLALSDYKVVILAALILKLDQLYQIRHAFLNPIHTGKNSSVPNPSEVCITKESNHLVALRNTITAPESALAYIIFPLCANTIRQNNDRLAHGTDDVDAR